MFGNFSLWKADAFWHLQPTHSYEIEYPFLWSESFHLPLNLLLEIITRMYSLWEKVNIRRLYVVCSWTEWRAVTVVGKIQYQLQTKVNLNRLFVSGLNVHSLHLRWWIDVREDKLVLYCYGPWRKCYTLWWFYPSFQRVSKLKREVAKPSPRRPKVRPNACIIDLTCDGEVEELTQEMDSIDLTRIFWAGL